ncbi:hypothetical protein, partial [Chitinophaga sp.]|uniref:hypothetical protein n=1 Tax=Chitinophaga sp. TaxID=1869181 RepID=UPI002F95F31E
CLTQDYTDFDDFPDFVFPDLKRLAETDAISTSVSANLFKSFQNHKSKNPENHQNQYNPE